MTAPFMHVPRPRLRDFKLSLLGSRRTPFASGHVEFFDDRLQPRFRLSLWRGKRDQAASAVHLEDVALTDDAAKQGTPEVLLHPSFGNSFTWEVPDELLQPDAEDEVFAVLTCLSVPPDTPLHLVVDYDPLEVATFGTGVRTGQLER